jgi:hypothetical protein
MSCSGVCVGEMKYPITIYDKDLYSALSSDEARVTLTPKLTTRAQIKPIDLMNRGIAFFNNVNINELSTHIFIIRFADIAVDDIIEFDGNYYKIQGVIDKFGGGNNKRFLSIYTIMRGLTSIERNLI